MSDHYTYDYCVALMIERAGASPDENAVLAAVTSIVIEMADAGLSTRVIGKRLTLSRDKVRLILYAGRLGPP